MNIVKEMIKQEQDRIILELEKKLKMIDLIEKKDEILNNIELRIDVSDLHINLEIYQTSRVEETMYKMHKKIFGFYPRSIYTTSKKTGNRSLTNVENGYLEIESLNFDYFNHIITERTRESLINMVLGWLMFNCILGLIIVIGVSIIYRWL